jgi:hypothetical protein
LENHWVERRCCIHPAAAGRHAFHREVNWELFDFAFAIALVGSVGIALELALRMTNNAAWRAGAEVALAPPYWSSASMPRSAPSVATPVQPSHSTSLYSPWRSLVRQSRLRAAGMARTMAAAAAAQMAAPIIAQLTGLGLSGFDDIRKVLILTAAFVALWMVTAWLFQRAAASFSELRRR